MARAAVLIAATFSAGIAASCTSPLLWGPSEAEIWEYHKGPSLHFNPPLISATGRFVAVHVRGVPGGSVSLLFDTVNESLTTIDEQNNWAWTVPRAFASTSDRIAFVIHSNIPDSRGDYPRELWEYDVETKKLIFRATLPSEWGVIDSLSYGPKDEFVVLPCAQGEPIKRLTRICKLTFSDGSQEVLLPTAEEEGKYERAVIRGFVSETAVAFNAPPDSGRYVGLKHGLFGARCFRFYSDQSTKISTSNDHYESFHSCSQSTNGKIIGIMRNRLNIYEDRESGNFERIGDLPLSIGDPAISGDGRYVAVLARHSQYPGKAVMWDLFLLDLEKKTQTRTHFREKILEFLRDKMDLRELKYVS